MDYTIPVEEGFEERCHAIIPEDRSPNENEVSVLYELNHVPHFFR